MPDDNMNHTPDKRIIDLARSFPSLRDAPGIDPWDPDKLGWWATEDESAPQRFYSAFFVLGVVMKKYRHGEDFSFYAAFEEWDAEHRAVFVE